MIFNVPGHIDMIRNGLYFLPTNHITPYTQLTVKTQTRRVNRGIYQVGKDYAVQSKRGVKAESDIRIIMDSIWPEWCDRGYGPMHLFLPDDAYAEGNYTVEEFERVFQKAYPTWDGKCRLVFRFHVKGVQK